MTTAGLDNIIFFAVGLLSDEELDLPLDSDEQLLTSYELLSSVINFFILMPVFSLLSRFVY